MQSGATSPHGVSQILVPVDGSDHARRAAEKAVSLAATYKAKLIVICAVVPPALYIAGPVGAPADLTEYFQLQTEDAKATLNVVLDMAKSAGVEARSEILQPATSVVEAIVEYAAEAKAELVVMGTRGLGGFKKMLLGSVSSGVIEHSPCSVLVVR